MLLKTIKSVGVKDTFPLIDEAREAGVKVLRKGMPGYDEALGEDGLQQFLKDLEYLDFVDDAVRGEGADNIASDDLQTRALDILEKALDGQAVYAKDDLPALERVQEYDLNVEAINEMFGGDLQDAENTLRVIEELEDKNYALISIEDLEIVRDLAAQVEKQNQRLGKRAKIQDIEAEILRDKNMIKKKSEAIKKKEKDL
jgi:hypothetical protein